MLVDLGDVDAIPAHLSLIGQVEASDHFGKGGLTGAVFSDQGDDLAAADRQIDPMQGWLILAGVAEGHLTGVGRSSTPISVGVPASGEGGLVVRRSLIVASQRKACLPR
jgi:hypothetical protein